MKIFCDLPLKQCLVDIGKEILNNYADENSTLGNIISFIYIKQY